MLVVLTIFISPILVGILALRPAAGALALLPILLLYPHNDWRNAQILPLNIGYDDIYISLLFAFSLLRRALLGPSPLDNRSFSVKIVGALALVVFVSNLGGILQLGFRQDLFTRLSKDVLKSLVMLFFTYNIVQSIRSPADLARHVFVLITVCCAAGILLIVSFYDPSVGLHFASTTNLEEMAALKDLRSYGSLSSANVAPGVLIVPLAILICYVKGERPFLRRVLALAAMVILVISILYSQSRAGMLTLGALLLSALLLGRIRLWGAAAIIGVIAVLALFPSTYQGVIRRLENIYVPSFGWDPNVSSRIEVWGQYLRDLNLPTLILGQGPVVGRISQGTLPHSGYLDLLCLYGIVGLAWGVWMYSKLISSAVCIHRRGGELRYCGTAMILYLLVVLVYGLTVDVFASQLLLFILCWILAITDRLAAMASLDDGGAEDPYRARRPEIQMSST